MNMSQTIEETFEEYLNQQPVLENSKKQMEGRQSEYLNKVNENQARDFADLSILKHTLELSFQYREAERAYSDLLEKVRQIESDIISLLATASCLNVIYHRTEMADGRNTTVKYLFSLPSGGKKLSVEKTNMP